MTHKMTASRALLRGAAFGLQVGVVVWVGLLLRQAMAVRGNDIYSLQHVTFGPLHLMSIGKVQIDSHLVARFNFEHGLIPYFIGWLFIGAIAGVAVLWLSGRALRQPIETDSVD